MDWRRHAHLVVGAIGLVATAIVAACTYESAEPSSATPLDSSPAVQREVSDTTVGDDQDGAAIANPRVGPEIDARSYVIFAETAPVDLVRKPTEQSVVLATLDNLTHVQGTGRTAEDASGRWIEVFAPIGQDRGWLPANVLIARFE